MSERKRDAVVPDEDREGFEARVQREAEKSRREDQAAVWGFGLMVLGALTVAVPSLTREDIPPNVILAGVVIMLGGGLIRDPRRFERIANRIIDALPWGKR